MALSPKQKTFVSEYLKDLNGTQAAIRAGYSPKTADVQASRLLTNVKVTEAVREAMRRREARTEVTQDRVIAELAKIAFSDATDFVEIVSAPAPFVDAEETEDGLDFKQTEQEIQIAKFKETKDIPPEKRAAIAEIKNGKFGVELRPCDKLKALELLGKHLGMFEKQESKEEELPDDGFAEALNGTAGDVWEK